MDIAQALLAPWYLQIKFVHLLFVPMEMFDFYLSHFGGNKAKILATGDMGNYERHIHLHWWFFLVTTPAVMLYGLTVMFLAITKPI